MEGLVGRTIASYRVLSPIGRGGQGIVYRAEHVTLGREVAFKVLAPELAADESFRQRFLREARLASALDHPNILDVYDAGQDGDILFLAERLVHGTDLAAIIRSDAPMSLDRTLGLLAPIADALDAAHAAGLVHRDVKPGNVLVEGAGRGRVYLSDFGLAKPVVADQDVTGSGRLTQSGYFVGTPDYSSPEQIRGQEVDARADVYSFAGVLYECLTGAVPFPRPSAVESILAHVNEPPPAVTDRRPDLPAGVDRVVRQALSKDPAGRQPTCGEVVRGLRGVPSEPPPAPPIPPGPGPVPAPRPRRRIAAIVVGAVAALGVVAILLVLLVGDEPTGPHPGATGTTAPATSAATSSATSSATSGPPATTAFTCTQQELPSVADVVEQGFAFRPDELAVAPCATISLTNRDDVAHTFTIDGSATDFLLIGGSKGSTQLALPPGTYVYYCRFHGNPDGSGMAGELKIR